MTAPKLPTSPITLVEDAILDDILAMPEEHLRGEFIEEGRSPDEAAAAARATLARAEKDCARRRMEAARAAAAAFRAAGSGRATEADRERHRTRLAGLRAGAPSASGMMLAARKGEGLSDRDEEGLLEDLADLERLEAEEDRDGRE